MKKTKTEYYSCASRGRNPDNPGDRRAGIYLEQRYEINWDQISNSITTVAKDSYVLEIMEETDEEI